MGGGSDLKYMVCACKCIYSIATYREDCMYVMYVWTVVESIACRIPEVQGDFLPGDYLVVV